MSRLIIFLIIASTLSCAQEYCDCNSYGYVDGNTGEIVIDAYSDFMDSCDIWCSASVYTDLSDNYGLVDSNDAVDNEMPGYVDLEIDDYVNLNDTYTEDSQHYVDGDIWSGDCGGDTCDVNDSAESYGSISIPAAPTIYADSVGAPGGSEAYIHYFASPPVLISADMLVGPDYSTTNTPNNANMPFNQDDIPYGTNTFSFRGFMFGYTIAPSSYPWVVRTRTPFNPVYETRGAACDENGEVQAFTVQASEVSDYFSYSISYSGVTDLSSGGQINISTDRVADCQFSIGVVPNTPPPDGTNEVRDVLFNDQAANLVQPAQTAPTPQSPYYQSLDNTWEYYFAPNAWGHLCTDFWIDGGDTGIAATSICLDTNLP